MSIYAELSQPLILFSDCVEFNHVSSTWRRIVNCLSWSIWFKKSSFSKQPIASTDLIEPRPLQIDSKLFVLEFLSSSSIIVLVELDLLTKPRKGWEDEEDSLNMLQIHLVFAEM